MLRIAVFGASGRMGRAVTRVVSASPDAAVVAAITEPGHPDIGRDAGELAGIAHLGVPIRSDAANAMAGTDIAIDFTLPVALADNLAACRTAGAGMIIGTTGLDSGQMQLIRNTSIEIPILYGRNLSIGVNVFTELARLATRYLGEGWEVEITEAHHRHKVDAPSGTALQLGEAVAAERGVKLADVAVYGRNGYTGERPPTAIGFHSIRAGNIVGDHTVSLVTDSEILELRHHAVDRELFAAGALRAGQWLHDKAPGLYSMRNVLGFD
jgi:4-hydroxy-tetrahydrodipicolinate reductase